MSKKNILLPALLVLLIAGVTLGYSAADFNTIKRIVRSFGTPLPFGTFSADGNAGRVIMASPTESDQGFYVDSQTAGAQVLSGALFLENIGWAEVVAANPITLIPPSAASNPVTTPWAMQGYLWSESAGYIDMSRVTYTPGTQAFSGYAWNDNIGWIDFTDAGNTFQNKVKILGAIGSNNVYNSEYIIGTQLGNATTNATFLNNVRKNIALMTRNVGSALINTSVSTNNLLNNNTMYYRANITVPASARMGNNDYNLRSLIVEGGNIYIDGDIVRDADVKSPRVIVAIKDANGNGGNIYIRNSIKNIYASLVAEGSIYSAESSTVIYNDTIAKLNALPARQLYINGSIISRNTIGGSAKNPPICPYGITGTCDTAKSAQYDWNYMRNFDGTGPNKSDYNGTDATQYSIIIQYDPAISLDPPPGIDQK